MFVLFSKTAVSLSSITFSNSVAVSVLLGNNYLLFVGNILVY